MTAPIDSDWAGNVVSNTNLNKTTYGQGTSFPSTYNTTRLFWRSDLGRMYYNKGSVSTPQWEGADIPVGTINMYVGASSDIPSGWLLCNGAAVSRTTYDALYNVIDSKYGVGNGSSTFNIPDFVTSNKFPRSASNDAGRGTTGGSSTHTLTSAESGSPAHNHAITDPGHTHQIGTPTNSNANSTNTLTEGTNGRMDLGRITGSSATGITVNNSSAVNASSPHENKPPFVDVHFIIAV